MPLIAPLLVEMGVNASIVAALVLSARVALFVHHFIKNRAL